MSEHPTREEREEMGAGPPPGTREEAWARRDGRDTGRGMGPEMGGMGMGPGGGGGGAPISLRDLRTFRSFKIPVFRLYYGAMIGQFAAMNMQLIARSLLVFELTGKGTALGIMALGNALPMLFFSLYGGVIADRVQKKYVLLAGQGASALISLGIALTLLLGFMSDERPNSWWILVVAALLQGTVMGLMMPSRQAMIAEIVGEEELMNAVALNSFGMNSTRLLAPIPVGFIIYLFDFQAVYFAMTAMYVMAVFFVSLMPLTGTIAIEGRGALGDIVDGIKYIRRNITILIILIFTLIVVLLSMPYMMLLPMFTENTPHVDSREYGTLLMVSGVGAMVGSIVLASLPNRGRGLMLIGGSLLLGVALVGMFFLPSWLPSFAWSLALLFILFVGLGQTARMTLGNTLLQYYVEDAYRGRVMALYFMEFGLTSLGVFFTGVLADKVGVVWSVGGLAIVLIAVCLLTLAFVPHLRKLA